jgi:rhodanese-related sulfurtransferase
MFRKIATVLLAASFVSAAGFLYADTAVTTTAQPAVSPAVSPVATVAPKVVKVKKVKKAVETKIIAAPAAVTNATVNAAPVPVSPVVRDISVFLKDAASKETINKIDIEEAWMLYNSGKALFVDARGVNEFDEKHIKGAISIPAGDTEKQIAANKDKIGDKILVTYCHGAGCHLSDKTANALFDKGYKKVAIFFGGWPKWDAAKYPEEGKSAK